MKSGLSAMYKWLDGARLARPPVPPSLAASIQQLDQDYFGTRDDVPHGLYADPTLMLAPDDREYLLLDYRGHGVNSYALSYFLVHGGIAAYLQIGLGGANMDNDHQRRVIADAFTELARLVDVSQGKPTRLTVFAWDMVGRVGWVKPGDRIHDAWAHAKPGDPAQTIAAARAFVEGG